jgi:mRNA interferase RelE/StbE
MKELQISNHAERQLSKLPESTSKKILIKLKQIMVEPQKAVYKKLKGYENAWSLRIGDYRVIFKIENNIMVITKIGHRKDIYK